MALLGNAAMLLWFDIVPNQIAELDEWLVREHFAERLGIPGFIRAQRWASRSAGPRYFIVYEVADVGVLSSAPYLARLNNPTPWTSRMMPHYRGMVRGFCRVESAYGTVLGTAGVTLRYSVEKRDEDRWYRWLQHELIADLMLRKGIASVAMFRSDRAPEMTAEQRIRGRDAGIDLVLLVTGYSPEHVTSLTQSELSASSVEAHGASPGSIAGEFQLACLSDARINATSPQSTG